MCDSPLWVSDFEVPLHTDIYPRLFDQQDYQEYSGQLVEYEDLGKVFAIQSTPQLLVVQDVSPKSRSNSQPIKVIEFSKPCLLCPTTLIVTKHINDSASASHGQDTIQNDLVVFKKLSVAIVCSDSTLLWFELLLEFDQQKSKGCKASKASNETNHNSSISSVTSLAFVQNTDGTQSTSVYGVAQDRILYVLQNASCRACRFALQLTKSFFDISIQYLFPNIFVVSNKEQELTVYHSLSDSFVEFGGCTIGSVTPFPLSLVSCHHVTPLQIDVCSISFPQRSVISTFHYFKSFLFKSQSNENTNYRIYHLKLCRIGLPSLKIRSSTSTNDTFQTPLLIYSLIEKRRTEDETTISGLPRDISSSLTELLLIWCGTDLPLRPIYELSYNDDDSIPRYSSQLTRTPPLSPDCLSDTVISDVYSEGQSNSNTLDVRIPSSNSSSSLGDAKDSLSSCSSQSSSLQHLMRSYSIFKSSDSGNTIALYRIKETHVESMPESNKSNISNDDGGDDEIVHSSPSTIMGEICVFRCVSSGTETEFTLKFVKRFAVPIVCPISGHPIDLELSDDTLWVLFPPLRDEIAPALIRVTIGNERQKKWERIQFYCNNEEKLTSTFLSSYAFSAPLLQEIDDMMAICSPYYTPVREDELRAIAELSIPDQRTQSLAWCDQLDREMKLDTLITPSLLLSIYETSVEDIKYKVMRNRIHTDNINEAQLDRDAGTIFESWVADLWTERITMNGRFTTTVLLKVLNERFKGCNASEGTFDEHQLKEPRLSSECPIPLIDMESLNLSDNPQRSTLYQAIRQLLTCIPPYSHKNELRRYSCAIAITSSAIQFIHRCNELELTYIGRCINNTQQINNTSKYKSYSLCLSKVWSQYLHSTAQPRITTKTTHQNATPSMEKQNILISAVSNCDFRPLIISKNFISLFLPFTRLWEIWSTTLNIEFHRIQQRCHTPSCYSAAINNLTSLLPNSLEWTLLICSKLLFCQKSSCSPNNDNRSYSDVISSKYSRIIANMMISLHRKLTDSICPGCSTSEKWVLNALLGVLQRVDAIEQRESGSTMELLSDPLDKQCIVEQLIGRAASKSSSHLISKLSALTRLICSSLYIPPGKDWDQWIDPSIIDVFRFLDPKSKTPLLQPMFLSQIKFISLLSQLHHSYSLGFDVLLLFNWVSVNLNGTRRRFETVASLASKQSNTNDSSSTSACFIWWDTRLGAGSGNGRNCMGLCLGQNGQITDLDFSYQSKLFTKVEQLRVIFNLMNNSDVPYLFNNNVSLSSSDFFLPCSSLVTPKTIVDRIARNQSWREGQQFSSELLCDNHGSGIIHYLLAVSSLMLSFSSDQLFSDETLSSFEKALEWETWVNNFSQLDSIKGPRNSEIVVDNINAIINSVEDELLRHELYLIKGSIIYCLHCSNLFHRCGAYSSEKFFVIRAIELLQKFCSFGQPDCINEISQSSDKDVSMVNNWHQYIGRRHSSSINIKKLEDDLRFEVFYLACETKEFDQAAKLLEDMAAQKSKNSQQEQRLLLYLLQSLLSAWETAHMGIDQVVKSIDCITSHQLFGMLLTYLAQLSLIIDPSSLRGRLLFQLFQRLLLRRLHNAIEAALHCYLLSALVHLRLNPFQQFNCVSKNSADHNYSENDDLYPSSLLLGLSSLIDEFYRSTLNDGLNVDPYIIALANFMPISRGIVPDNVELLRIQRSFLRDCLTRLESAPNSFGYVLVPQHYFNVVILHGQSDSCDQIGDVVIYDHRIKQLELITVLKADLLSSFRHLVPEPSEILKSSSRNIAVLLAQAGLLQKSLWCCKKWKLPFKLAFAGFIEHIVKYQFIETEQAEDVREKTASWTLVSRPQQSPRRIHTIMEGPDLIPSPFRTAALTPIAEKSRSRSAFSAAYRNRNKYEELHHTHFRGRQLTNKRIGRESDIGYDDTKEYSGPSNVFSKRRKGMDEQTISTNLADPFGEGGLLKKTRMMSSKSSKQLWDHLTHLVDVELSDASKSTNDLSASDIFCVILNGISTYPSLRLPSSTITWMVCHPSHAEDPLHFIRLLIITKPIRDSQLVSIAIQYLSHLSSSSLPRPIFPVFSSYHLLQFDLWAEGTGSADELQTVRQLLTGLLHL